MKIIKILQHHSKHMSEESIRKFIYKNLPTEMIHGLEYDEPKTMERALKLLGVQLKSPISLEQAAKKSKEPGREHKLAASA